MTDPAGQGAGIGASQREPSGYGWRARHVRTVEITHDRRRAATVRGPKARDFRTDKDECDPDTRQDIMARLAGNYRHRIEPVAMNHARNAV